MNKERKREGIAFVLGALLEGFFNILGGIFEVIGAILGD